jgi:hypothetical protein
MGGRNRLESVAGMERNTQHMTEEEKILATSWYDPRYEVVDTTDYVWWVQDGFEKRIQRSYEAGDLSSRL